MTERPRTSPAGAGFTLLATVLLCAGLGLGIGFVLGAPALLAVVGVFAGFAVGFRLVYTRFRDI
jgi:hypothetical protein